MEYRIFWINNKKTSLLTLLTEFLMTFLEKNDNFAYTNSTLVKQKSIYHVFFVFWKFLCRQPKRGAILDFAGQIQI